jgi:hypothetical protein
LLNRAARFFPILRELRSNLPSGGTLLEVGSGAVGLGEFWAVPFVGCDLTFSSRPLENMRAVQCSGHQLPFADGAFDGVVVSDVMEHVMPEHRRQVVSEVLRVARTVAVVGYPCGPLAFEIDRRLYREYRSQNLAPPVWLEEHMLHTFPDEGLFAELPTGWNRRILPNETLDFHYWMMRTEMFRLCDRSFRLALRIMPGVVDRFLRLVNREPSYRKIFVLTREPLSAHV